MIEQLSGAYQAWPLLFWLAGSLLIYALASNTAWLVTRSQTRKGRPVAVWVRWAAELCALPFFVAVPYLALGGWPMAPFSGLLSLADMGVAGLGGDWPVARWLESIGTGLALGLVGVATLVTGWGLANRGGGRLDLPARGGRVLLLHGLAREVHWSFYRSALTVTVAMLVASSPGRLLPLGSVYVGTWAALALVVVEWSLNPAWREAWRDPARAGLAWFGVGLALLSTLIFLLTRNLWICIAVHWLVAGAVDAVARRQ